MYEIESHIRLGLELPEFTQDEVKNEIMLFNCNVGFALNNGGPITQSFIRALAKERLPMSNMVIDTRVHMLMRDWFPCIPGFHHDDVPRSRVDGQPNYDTPEYRSQHVMAMINGDICPTEFAVGEFKMFDVPIGGTIYKEWHQEVEAHLAAGRGERVSAPSNRLVHFDDRSFHQGTRAVASGWRWFGRASYQTNRQPTNEIRRQVQVYLEHPMEGW